MYLLPGTALTRRWPSRCDSKSPAHQTHSAGPDPSGLAPCRENGCVTIAAASCKQAPTEGSGATKRGAGGREKETRKRHYLFSARLALSLQLRNELCCAGTHCCSSSHPPSRILDPLVACSSGLIVSRLPRAVPHRDAGSRQQSSAARRCMGFKLTYMVPGCCAHARDPAWAPGQQDCELAKSQVEPGPMHNSLSPSAIAVPAQHQKAASAAAVNSSFATRWSTVQQHLSRLWLAAQLR
jgi:hypothetical protein